MICVNCGKNINIDAVEGSAKEPYCKSCFKRIFKNDYDKYFEYLEGIGK